jgi:hypothetical protein
MFKKPVIAAFVLLNMHICVWKMLLPKSLHGLTVSPKVRLNHDVGPMMWGCFASSSREEQVVDKSPPIVNERPMNKEQHKHQPVTGFDIICKVGWFGWWMRLGLPNHWSANKGHNCHLIRQEKCTENYQ